MISPPDQNGHLPKLTPAQIARAMTGRDYLSYSQITTYQTCSLKWWYSHVEKAPKERVSAALLLGSGVHAAIEHLMNAKMSADPTPPIEELMQVFRETWSEDASGTPIQFGKGEDEASQAATAQRMLEAFLESDHSKDAGELIGVEENVRTILTWDLPDVLGVVDKIELRDGVLILTDFKTARAMWTDRTSADHADQLTLYAKATEPMAKALNARIELQFCVITKTKSPKIQTFSVAYTPERLDRSTAIMKRIFKSMQLGVVYPNPSASNCMMCAYQTRCRTWHVTSQKSVG